MSESDDLTFASAYIPGDGSAPIVHSQRCWSCTSGSHFEPAQWHGWADDEDLDHARETGQDVEAIRAQRCGCWCAEGAKP